MWDYVYEVESHLKAYEQISSPPIHRTDCPTGMVICIYF